MKPVTLDGWIYVWIAVCAAIVASFSSDDVYKYVPPTPVWWIKHSFTWLGAGFLALKMFRSTTFAEYRAVKNGSYHAETTTQTSTSTDTAPGSKTDDKKTGGQTGGVSPTIA